MTNLLSRGRLEVETDLLLGAEEVLLPEGVRAVRDQPVVDTNLQSSRTAAPIRFESALFASEPPSANAPRGSSHAAPHPAPLVQGTGVRGSIFGGHSTGVPAGAVETRAPVPMVDRVIAPAGATKSERLALLDALHGRECPHCTAATAHTRLVFGEGSPDAELVFVGEAPGESEDRVGRPFVGRAGEKLDEMIGAMGLRREDVYIANVLKSRPPDNRTPLAHEVDRCGPYLLAQLAVIHPKVIVSLGGPATKLLLATELGITRMRGVLGKVELGRAEGAPFDVPVMPTFHPAYLLRNYTLETRTQVWEDLKKVLDLLGRAIPTRPASRADG